MNPVITLNPTTPETSVKQPHSSNTFWIHFNFRKKTVFENDHILTLVTVSDLSSDTSFRVPVPFQADRRSRCVAEPAKGETGTKRSPRSTRLIPGNGTMTVLFGQPQLAQRHRIRWSRYD
ncbi:hypothetical protein AVEN_43052-1 [Araneus ventricosus]|uniref:Uncharacterized protein n=1 Tax=Araneus ventricosus TaxID=182803 RepID=A0A4Y2H600_ARAVE|nr:hypothetical protein AVEN_43052-1 [Araneus ventricosus]